MNRRRLAFAWIACLAVLFNMLAMSTAGATQSVERGPTEQFMWSSFCSSTGTKMVAVSLGTFEPADNQHDDHSTMQHCWCCSGAAPLVALPGHVPQLYLTQFNTSQRLPPAQLQSPTPRQQWPSLNPRASPVA